VVANKRHRRRFPGASPADTRHHDREVSATDQAREIDEAFELGRVHIAYVVGADGQLAAAFKISGRDYGDASAMLRDLDAAWDEFARRRISAEFETRSVEDAGSAGSLPSWQEYRSRLSAG
jgi:hypothetical protein